jgi:Lrp/AsnC family transcriptional regulator for asnA, asnC and gidA
MRTVPVRHTYHRSGHFNRVKGTVVLNPLQGGHLRNGFRRNLSFQHLPRWGGTSHDRLVSPRKSVITNNQAVERRPAGGGLDDVSKAIIEHLQADGRRPYSTIAKHVGLSEAAVRQRVQRLLDSEVMQIVAVTDPLQLGFNRQAMVGIRVEGDTQLVADRLADLSEVDYVVTTAGSFDLLVEVVCEDDDELLDLLSRRIRTVPGVVSTETFVYLKLNKQHYNWGTR